MSVKMVSVTKGLGELSNLTPEELIAYCARVSNPTNQMNSETSAKLLAYCIKNKHWSVFEQVDLGVEVVTSRAIAAQILRHRSFCFQEFSQRYAKAIKAVAQEARRQDVKNRQNSLDDLTPETKQWFKDKQTEIITLTQKYYEEALEKGIAKESARFLLPLNTTTKLYIKGSVRSWITYLMVRLDKATQLEHRQVAEDCWNVFKEEFPVISGVLKEMQPELFK